MLLYNNHGLVAVSIIFSGLESGRRARLTKSESETGKLNSVLIVDYILLYVYEYIASREF